MPSCYAVFVAVCIYVCTCVHGCVHCCAWLCVFRFPIARAAVRVLQSGFLLRQDGRRGIPLRAGQDQQGRDHNQHRSQVSLRQQGRVAGVGGSSPGRAGPAGPLGGVSRRRWWKRCKPRWAHWSSRLAWCAQQPRCSRLPRNRILAGLIGVTDSVSISKAPEGSAEKIKSFSHSSRTSSLVAVY